MLQVPGDSEVTNVAPIAEEPSATLFCVVYHYYRDRRRGRPQPSRVSGDDLEAGPPENEHLGRRSRPARFKPGIEKGPQGAGLMLNGRANPKPSSVA